MAITKVKLSLLKIVDYSQTPEQNFARFVIDIQREKRINQEKLAEILGNKASTISRWETGTIHPENVDFKFIIGLAHFKEWSLDRLHDYLYNVPAEYKNYVVVKPAVDELPTLDKIKLLSHLSQEIDKAVAYKVTEEFRKILYEFIEENGIDYREAARITGIMPSSRFLALLGGTAPEKVDLIKLATCNAFKNKQGRKYSFDELVEIVFGR